MAAKFLKNARGAKALVVFYVIYCGVSPMASGHNNVAPGKICVAAIVKSADCFEPLGACDPTSFSKRDAYCDDPVFPTSNRCCTSSRWRKNVVYIMECWFEDGACMKDPVMWVSFYLTVCVTCPPPPTGGGW